MIGTPAQPALFTLDLEPGSHVKVFHESGDFEGAGVVRSTIWDSGRAKTVLVQFYDGRAVCRSAHRVVPSEDVIVL